MSRSISTTISLVFSAVILASTLLLGYLVYSASSGAFIEVSRERLLHTAGIIELRLTERLSAVSNDVNFLMSNQAVQTIADARGPEQTDPARERLAAVFGALLRTRADYTQVRLIGSADNGRELLRLDRVGTTIVYAREPELQSKGDRKYFLETIALPAGRVHISDINLNREQGEVSLPFLPTVRVSTPVYTSTGEVFGILVINVDAGRIFNDLIELTGPGISLLLANERGDYLIHPDARRTFSFDRGWDFRIQDDYPILRELYEGRRGTAYSEELGDDDDRTLTYFRRVLPFPGSERFVVLAIISPYDLILRDAAEIEVQGLILTIVISLIGLVAIWIFARFLMRPLERITTALTKYNAGDAVSALPTDRSDEFGALARAFESMSERVRDEMRSKDDFLATMSHEIRTPMNAVVGMTHLLKRDGPTRVDRRVIDTLDFAAGNLMSLINDILDYNKLRAGALELESSDFELAPTFEAIVASYRPAAAQRGVLVHLNLASDLPPYLCGDRLRMTQIVNNLLDNAIKFTEEGEVVVSVRHSDAEPTTLPGKDGIYLRIEVRDSGIGIEADRLPHIFEQFTQARSDTARKFGGSGLGLAIVKKLVTLHGGNISVSSTPGEGSVFRVDLPLRLGAAPAAADDKRLDPAQLDFDGARILYVEDVEYNRFLLDSLVKPWNVVCVGASGGLEGLALSREQKFDLILLDIQMPDMDGPEVLEHLRAEPDNPNRMTPAAALSAMPNITDQTALKHAGFDDALEKPIDPARLAQLLQRWLKVRAASDGETASATKESSAPPPDMDDAAELPAMFVRMYDNDPKLMSRALELLIQECGRQIPLLRAHFESGDAAALGKVLHRLSPHLKTFGLQQVGEDLRAVRTGLSEAGVSPELESRLNAGIERLESFARGLEAALEKISSGR